MKIGRPISEEVYERELASLVARFETKSRAEYDHGPETRSGRIGRYSRLYWALRQHGPMSVGEAATAAGLPHWEQRDQMLNRIALQQLEQTGWIRRTGIKPQQWHCFAHHGVTTRQVAVFEAISKPRQTHLQRYAREFLAAVERLERRRAIGLRLTSRIFTNDQMNMLKRIGAQRNAEMIERRLNGDCLRAIGADYGLTHERVRQIVERALGKKGGGTTTPRLDR
jgi:hypothetical protein